MDHLYQKLFADAEFQALQRTRSRLTWTLSALMLTSYFAFILLIAFCPDLLAAPIAIGSVITRGIPVAVGVMLFGFVLTGVYVYRANGEFDRRAAAIIERYAADD